MLNKEKFAKEIVEIAINGIANDIAVVDGKPCMCKNTRCKDCDFNDSNYCSKEFKEWANSEYKEPEIDWERVPVDTPVLVWDMDGSNKLKRHYAGLRNGCFVTFDNGETSWSFSGEISSWLNCELARKEDIQKYRKR